jgi:Fur family ferric uptake transcriptional regulator
MPRSDTYNTKQKELIVNTIKKEKKEFTVKDIYEELNKSIGLTTIYRLVDKLVEEGILLKSISNDNTTHYQYLSKCEEENHFYLKCDKCGDLEHVDCDCIDGLTKHIFKEHDFKPNKEHIIINGTCKNCSKEY